MGCYAEAVRTRLSKADVEPPLGAQGGWVVVSESEWEPARIRSLFPSCSRLLVLSNAEERGGNGCVRYGQILSGPSRLSAAAREELGVGYDAAILLEGRSSVSGRVLFELLRQGVRRVAYRDPLGWVVKPTRWVIASKPVARIERRLASTRMGSWYRIQMSRAHAHAKLRLRNRQAFPGEDEWRRHMARVRIREGAWREPGDPIKVVQHIGQLNSGGAERQLANLSVALKKRGHHVRVLTTYPLNNEDAHYLDLLEDAGVPVGPAGSEPAKRVEAAFEQLDLHPELIGSLSEAIRTPVLDLVGELLADPPDILHCWLDHPNVVGGIAGAIVGTPLILLSTRNVNPTNFPAFYQTWMDLWYANLSQVPQVRLLANSRAGADDYAQWMKTEGSRFHVIPNGVDTAAMGKVPSKAIQKFRREICLRRGQKLVAGVFRLAPEKQPLLFLDVIKRARKKVPKLKVVIAGVGPMRQKVEEEICARGLKKCVILLGQRRDVRVILASADALLLTSNAEGTPNVVLEAQLLGCPAVATDVGGTSEVLEHGRTGYLHARDDAAGMALGLVTLLRNPDLRRTMGEAGRSLVKEKFSMERVFQLTEEFYQYLLADAALEREKEEDPPPVQLGEAQ